MPSRQNEKKVKKKEWSTIVYNSLEVRSSFELYIDKEKILLEHVPGIWESDSKLMADILLLKKSDAYCWLVDHVRTAKYEDFKGVKTKEIEPINLEKVKIKLERLLPILLKVRKLLDKDLPLNIHFISDGNNFYFLNCRLTDEIHWEYNNDKLGYKVQSVSDLEKWDGKTAILFTPQIKRGDEMSLLAFIPFLKKAKVPIFAEFGILSHPAILLREFGIQVLPKLSEHHFYKIKTNI